MLRIHKTGDGDQMMVCEMTDQHLIRTIRQKCQRVQQLLFSSQQAQVANPALATFYKRGNTLTPEVAAEKAKEELERLYPYLAEALVREDVAKEIRPLVRLATGRKELEDAQKESPKFLSLEELDELDNLK